MSIQVSRSAFRRDGTTINMKPGVQTLKVGVIDVTGVTLDTDYAIDVTSHLPVYKDNRSGENTTKTFAFTEDLFDTGTTIIKTALLPSLAKILVNNSSNQATRTGSTVQQGDIDIQQDNELAYIYTQNSVWKALAVTPTTYAVDVSSSKFRFNGKGLASNLTWENSTMPDIRVLKGQTYTFDQSDNTNSGHPLLITTEDDGGDTDGNYTTGVIYRIDGVVKTQAQYDTAFDSYSNSAVYTVEFTVPHSAPNTLYVQCANHANMGAKLVVETAQDLTSISGNVVPSANGTQDLGSTTKRWNELFLGGTDPVINFGTDRVLPGSYDYTNFFAWLKTADANFGGAGSDAFSNLLSKKQIENSYYTKTDSDARYLQSGGTAGNLTLENANGGQLFIGDSGTTIASNNVLGKINFTSDDSNLSANNVHAYIEAKTNSSIDANTKIGHTDLSFYTGTTSLSKALQIGSDGKTTLYDSPIVQQKAKPSFTSTTDDSGNTYLTQAVNTNVFPVNYSNIVANTSDDNLYYIHRKADTNLTVSSTTSNYEIYEETNLTGFINGVQNLTTTSPAYAINVSQLKINGVVIDLDNISSNYDFWSANQATTTITSTAGTKSVTPTVTLPQLGTNLIPSDATLTNVTLLLKWRLTSNSASSANNVDTSSMKIQTRQGSGSFTDAYTFSTGSYHVPATSSASGEILSINLNLSSSDLTSLKSSLSSGTVTYTIQIAGAKSAGDSLILRDLSWGLRLYWR